MLCRWLAAIRLEHYVHRRESLAVGINDLRTKLEHQCRSRRAQRIGWTTQGVDRWARGSHHLVQHPGRADLALKRRAVDGRLEIGGAEFVKHLDDLVAAKVCGIAHRRPPIAVANGGVLVQQVGILHNQLADCVDIVAPDGVDEFAGLDQARPARCLVTACEYELRIGEPDLIGCDGIRVMLVEFLDRGRIAAPDVAE